MARILIIDDNETMREGLGATVRRMGHEAVLAASGEEGLKQFAAGRNSVDFVITDLKMEGKGGLEVLKAVAERDPDCPVMIATAFGSVETAVEAMRTGAYDFIQKPFAPEVVRLKVARALELRAERRARERAEAESAALRDDVAREYRFAEIVGETSAMRALFQTIEKVAPTDASVYIHGESGTGKELVARAVHARSKRADGPFVKVNCGALTETLLESELFGHERGAFTGAIKRKLGRFELADKGTLFLDEIGDVTPALQLKLLRVLQERAFERVGGGGRRRTLSGGSLLSAARGPLRGSTAARAQGGHPAAGGALHHQAGAPHQRGNHRDHGGRAGAPRRLRLARQRSRARERDRAGARVRGRDHHRHRGAAGVG